MRIPPEPIQHRVIYDGIHALNYSGAKELLKSPAHYQAYLNQEREETKAAFDKAGVQVLVGDWTRRDASITRYLTAQGAAGVPLYIWYPAQGEPQQLPQVLSVGTLTDLVR